MALVHSTLFYITLPWLYFNLLDYTLPYHGSTLIYFTLSWFYFTLLYCILICKFSYSATYCHASCANCLFLSQWTVPNCLQYVAGNRNHPSPFYKEKMNGPHSAHQAAKPSREAMCFHPVDEAISLVPPFSQVQCTKLIQYCWQVN